jgi:hypothetical protein
MFRIAIALLWAMTLPAQVSPLERLRQELKSAREQDIKEEWQAIEGFATENHNALSMSRVHAALRAWIESRLPMGKSASAVKSSNLEMELGSDLKAAIVAEKASSDNAVDSAKGSAVLHGEPGFGSVIVSLDWKPELPDILFVNAGAAVRCGTDEALYAYRFDGNGWARIIEDRPSSDFGYGFTTLKVSDPDAQRRRLLLIHRTSVQCASTWMSMTYSVYRMSASERPPELLVSDGHGFYLHDEDPIVLKPDEVMLEFLDHSVEGGVHSRTHILRLNLADGLKRLEPVAFQPQDFAEEWLTRPWSEMQKMSAAETQKWHDKLQAPYIFGDFIGVVLCTGRPDHWSIGLEINNRDGKELKEPIMAYLLVRDLGNYHFFLDAVSDSAFEGCSGKDLPSDKHPWLSIEQLKALP